jgi:hypothetical protein
MKRFVTRALIVVAAILGIVFAQVAPASANELSAAGLPPNWHIHDGQLAPSGKACYKIYSGSTSPDPFRSCYHHANHPVN